MPPQYSAFEPKTNVTADDILSLDAAAGEDGAVVEAIIGGEVVTSTAGRIRLSRSASGVTPVAADVQQGHPSSPVPRIQAADGWSTQPTLDAGGLMATGWNLHGGVVRWQAAPGEEFEIIGAEQISLRDVLTTANLTGLIIWIEH